MHFEKSYLVGRRGVLKGSMHGLCNQIHYDNHLLPSAETSCIQYMGNPVPQGYHRSVMDYMGAPWLAQSDGGGGGGGGGGV